MEIKLGLSMWLELQEYLLRPLEPLMKAYVQVACPLREL